MRAVLWAGGETSVLPIPAGFDNATLGAVNSSGFAAGRVENVDSGLAAALWNGDAWAIYEPLHGYTDAWLNHISEAGLAVGGMYNGEAGVPIRVAGGELEEMPILAGWSHVSANRALEDGTVLGGRVENGRLVPVRWVEGVPEDVETPYESSDWSVTAYGADGRFGLTNFLEPDAVWVGDGRDWLRLDGLADWSSIRSINASGDFLISAGSGEALLWTGGELFDLTEAFTLPDGAWGPQLTFLADDGTIAGSFHAEGRPYAMLLRPVPAPAPAVVLGLAGLLGGRRARRAAAAAALIAPAAGAQPPTRYFLDVLGPYEFSLQTYAALDDEARVVGTLQGAPVLWEAGQPHILPVPEGYACGEVADISRWGILGVAVDADHRQYPIIWVDGEPRILSELSGRSLHAGAVSPVGHVVVDEYPSGFRWHDGVVEDLGNLGRDYTQVEDVNAEGQVVGSSRTRGSVTHAFVWADGSMTDLGILPDRAHSVARAINGSGVVAGECYTYDWDQGTPFVWESGAMTALPLAGDRGIVLAMNDAGVIVGETWDGADPPRGVVWIDGEVHRLDGVLVADEVWAVSVALDINGRGQILGRGTLGGQEYGVVLTPACAGDFNLDRAVDTRDVVSFLGAWASGAGGADFDGDGVVDTRDVAAFLAAWAGGCP
jgi:probable HAF family extracellular repeat protein